MPDIKLKTNQINIAMKATGGVGTKDHSLLNNLDYEHSGHTGFASAEQINQLLELINKKQNVLTAGDNISIIDDVISVTGLDKDEIYIGPDEPTDPNIKLWIDTSEQGGDSFLPAYPENDGNYNLSAQVDGDIVTLVWVPAASSGVWQLPNKQGNNLNLFQCVTINKIKNQLEVY